MQYQTIIISDIHIPSPDNKYREVLAWLQEQKFKHLILNGDIIDGWHIALFGGRKRRHSNRRKDIIALARKKRAKLTYIIGNHDINIDKKLPWLKDEVNIVPDMLYEAKKKTYYICHGHQFDRLEGKFTFRSKITFCGGTFLYRLNRVYNNLRQKIGLKHHSLIAHLKRLIKILMVGGPSVFHKKLVKMCKEKKTQGIICGHLHKAEKIRIGRYDYLNSGDRIELCTALVEQKDGKWKIINTLK